jgi:hypothetical protein
VKMKDDDGDLRPADLMLRLRGILRARPPRSSCSGGTLHDQHRSLNLCDKALQPSSL